MSPALWPRNGTETRESAVLLLIKRKHYAILYVYFYAHWAKRIGFLTFFPASGEREFGERDHMEKILSIIVPSYNAEKFLDVGIPSFLEESVLDFLDIIIVNDGSTDATAEKAQTYVDRHPGSVRLISQVNKGHGGALNTGCAAAQGKFLRIVDADDWVQTKNLAPFVEFLRTCDSDAVLNHYRTVDISTGEIAERRVPEDALGKVLTLKDMMNNRSGFERLFALHAITYRTDFYREKGIQLTEHVFYEDVEYATIPLCLAKTISCVDLYLYEYRIGDVTQSVSDSSQLKRISHVCKVLDRMIREYVRLADQLDEGQNWLYCIKTRSLLLRGCTTMLLLEPDRAKGRRMAEEQVALMRSRMPRVYDMMHKEYQMLRMMNILHISKNQWDGFLQSALYHKLRNLLR